MGLGGLELRANHAVAIEPISGRGHTADFLRSNVAELSLAFALLALFALIAVTPDANAVVCARGVYRAGCAGPRGAVVVRHPYHYHYYRGVRVYR
jgi:hypothetical protein